MISNKGLVTISAFMSSCDDLINGKFIFATNKVSNILKSINESPELYEVISECLKEFNYEKEFGRAKNKLPTKKGNFKLPESYTSLIPLVFCMLVEIQDGKIDFKQFLADYFDNDEEKTQYECFAEEVIVPFKNAIAYLFDIEGKNKFAEQKEEQKAEPKKEEVKKTYVTGDKETTFLEAIKETATDIVETCNVIKIKDELNEDISYLVSQLNKAIESKNISQCNALIIGVIYAIKQHKKLRRYEYDFRDALEEYYL